ncbi:hypothetical protein CQW23_21772 [Capsicum baccatum]|uniref:Pentatricopeptide repeat-containing protein n=1 Tax=Capsicum baccatum TaxID=33114 RepID=A0A2G2VZ25_CAPBA|nr:hypothetical protein CQW23_21772 [Capsicum baccatum]
MQILYQSRTRCHGVISPSADPKYKHLDYANRVFELMEVKYVVSWNTLVTGYSQIRRFDEALGLFERMREEEIELNVVTWSVVILGFRSTSSRASVASNFSNQTRNPKVIDGIKMKLFRATTITKKIILEGGFVVVDNGSGSGAAVGASDYDYDHTALTTLAFQMDAIVEATTEEHNIIVDNPSTASKDEEKVESISLGERKNYPFEGFNILDEALKKLTQLINGYSEWIGDGLLKNHADRKQNDEHYKVNESSLVLIL